MSTLTVTAKGQVTLKKDVLRHLGVKPGEKVEIDTLPGGAVSIQAARKGSVEDFIGFFAGEPDTPSLTIDEINEAIAKGWAGES